jgi:uncharacterized repeat protein (TIGR04138 family)
MRSVQLSRDTLLSALYPLPEIMTIPHLFTRRTNHRVARQNFHTQHERNGVAELAFRDGIMDRIRVRETRFDERAYLFVLTALEFCQQRLPERRHINGRELALACRDLALDHYGVLARIVLEHWGVRSTADLGDVVFTLVDLELLMSQPTDTREEFIGVFDFEEAFEREYPWCGVQPV